MSSDTLAIILSVVALVVSLASTGMSLAGLRLHRQAIATYARIEAQR